MSFKSAYFCSMTAILFSFPLTFSDFPDVSGGEKGERKDEKGFDENGDNISSTQDFTISF